MSAKIVETQTEATPFDTACEEVAAEHYSLPYGLLTTEQQLSLTKAIAERYATIKSSIINQLITDNKIFA